PSCAKRALTCGSASAATAAALSLPITSAGGALGGEKYKPPGVFRPWQPGLPGQGIFRLHAPSVGGGVGGGLLVPGGTRRTAPAACTRRRSTWPEMRSVIAGPAPR